MELRPRVYGGGRCCSYKRCVLAPAGLDGWTGARLLGERSHGMTSTGDVAAANLNLEIQQVKRSEGRAM